MNIEDELAVIERVCGAPFAQRPCIFENTYANRVLAFCFLPKEEAEQAAQDATPLYIKETHSCAVPFEGTLENELIRFHEFGHAYTAAINPDTVVSLTLPTNVRDLVRTWSLCEGLAETIAIEAQRLVRKKGPFLEHKEWVTCQYELPRGFIPTIERTVSSFERTVKQEHAADQEAQAFMQRLHVMCAHLGYAYVDIQRAKYCLPLKEIITRPVPDLLTLMMTVLPERPDLTGRINDVFEKVKF